MEWMISFLEEQLCLWSSLVKAFDHKAYCVIYKCH